MMCRGDAQPLTSNYARWGWDTYTDLLAPVSHATQKLKLLNPPNNNKGGLARFDIAVNKVADVRTKRNSRAIEIR
jgi:hypothetical protein